MKDRMNRKVFIVIFVIVFVLVLLGALLGYLYRDYNNKLEDTTHKFNVPVSKYMIVDGTMVTSEMVEIKEMILDSTDGIVMNINEVVGKCVKKDTKVDAKSTFKTSDLEDCGVTNEN